MKILFVCGSPRKSGNTATILNALKDSIHNEFQVELCYLSDYKINGCLGCSKCQKILDEPCCVQKDDAKGLLEMLIEADVILYGTPLYGHSYSGQMKIFMDRHVALFKFVSGGENSVDGMEIRSFIGGKHVGLVVSCQGPEENNTELIKMQFDKFCESSLTQCFGKYVFPCCNPDAKQSDYSQITMKQMLIDMADCKLKLS